SEWVGIGALVGAAAGLGVAAYLCHDASDGAICIHGYVLYTLGGAAIGTLVSLILTQEST
ncbi:MAG: hypothetical protein ACREMQ_05395, partial [Longimicrobiales bacterium]